MAGSNTLRIPMCANRMNFGTFTPGNVNPDGSIVLARDGILGPNIMLEHEEIFPGRDHMIRQLD